MSRIVAIVIGVQSTVGFTPLPGAAEGARQFAGWARQKGFEVYPFIDADTGPVRREAIEERVTALLDPPTISKLFIYFAGHGFAMGLSKDYWLLTSGLQSGANIINAGLTIELARWAPIPHIVVFADACRTLPPNDGLATAEGCPAIFPTLRPPVYPGVVDVYYASQTGYPAFERHDYAGPDRFDQRAIKAHGIFTKVLMEALSGTNLEAACPDPGTGARVVLASSLKLYLTSHVPDETAELTQAEGQQPDCRDASELPLYISDVSGPDTAKLTVHVVEEGGRLAPDATLSIYKETDKRFDRFALLDTTSGPTYERSLPTSAIYGIQTSAGDYIQDPDGPCEIYRLMDDKTIEVLLKRPTHTTERPAALSPPEPPSLLRTYVVDERGKSATTAPQTNVYAVVSEDLLTGRTASELRLVQGGAAPAPVASLHRNTSAEKQVEAAASRVGRQHFETRTGMSIVGAQSMMAAQYPDAPGLFYEGSLWHVRPALDLTSAALVIALDGDRFAATAMLAGFIGTLAVGMHGVDDLSYAPAPNGPFDLQYPEAFLAAARYATALASAAARFGRFEVATDEALEVARTLRQYKHFDPVLGIFAAHAYHRVGDRAQILDIIRHFRAMGQDVPYDIALLATTPTGPIATSRRAIGHGLVFEPEGQFGKVVPRAFPLLTQTWALMGPDEALHPALARFRRALAPSLWATATGEGGRALFDAIAEGAIA